MDKTGITKRLTNLNTKRSGLAVGLWGEPGIGKTFLVNNLLKEAKCRAIGLHSTVPITQLLAALPTVKKLPVWGEQTLQKLLRGEHVEAKEAGAVIGAILATGAPLLLYLEDIHEVNPERLDFIRALAISARASKGVGLLVSSRSLPPEPFECERLLPFTETETAFLLQQELGGNLPQEALSWVYGRALGNPLFSLEYFRALTRQGFLWNDSKSWHWRPPEKNTVPLTVEALIESVLNDVLKIPELAATVAAHAMLALDATPSLRAEVAGIKIKTLLLLEQQLTARGVLRDAGFAHPLYKEIALQHLDSVTRTALARRALAALGNDPRAAARCIEDAQLPATESLAAFLHAATAAKTSGNTVEAARHLAAACKFTSGETWAQLALEAANGLRHVDVVEAQRLAELASLESSQRSDALFLIADLMCAQGKISEAEHVLQSLEADVFLNAAHDPTQQSLWWGRRLQLYSMNRQHGRVLEMLKAQPEMLSQADTTTVYRAARALVQSGETKQAKKICDDALKRPNLNAHDRAYVLKGLAMIALEQTHWAEMESLEAEVQTLAESIGNLRLKDAALYNRALALGFLGRYQEQMQCLEAAMHVCRELGDTTALVIAQNAYGSALVQSGEYERSEAFLLEARDALMRVDTTEFLIECERNLAHLYLEWQPPHGKMLALKHASAALAVARTFNDPSHSIDPLHYLAASEAWAGNIGKAHEHAKEALRLANALHEQNQDEQNALPFLYSAKNALAQVLWFEEKSEPETEIALTETMQVAKQLGDTLGFNMLGLQLNKLQNNIAEAKKRLDWFEENGLGNGVRFARRLFNNFNETVPASVLAIKTSTPILRVLGPMCLNENILRGRKRQDLLASLLEARIKGRAEVSRLALIETLYPNTDELQASTALKALVHQVRADTDTEIIITTNLGYALGQILSDAELFLRLGDTTLWRGQYLPDLESDANVRESLQAALTTALEKMLAAHSHEKEEMIRVANILLEAEPYDRKILGLALQAQKTNSPQLQRMYNQAKLRFAEVGEHLPETWAGAIGLAAAQPSASR